MRWKLPRDRPPASRGATLTEHGDAGVVGLSDPHGGVGGVTGELQVTPRARRHCRAQVGGGDPASSRRQVYHLCHLPEPANNSSDTDACTAQAWYVSA